MLSSWVVWVSYDLQCGSCPVVSEQMFVLFKGPYYIVVVECSLLQGCIVFEPHVSVCLVLFPAEFLWVDVPVHQSIFDPRLSPARPVPVSHKVCVPPANLIQFLVIFPVPPQQAYVPVELVPYGGFVGYPWDWFRRFTVGAVLCVPKGPPFGLFPAVVYFLFATGDTYEGDVCHTLGSDVGFSTLCYKLAVTDRLCTLR